MEYRILGPVEAHDDGQPLPLGGPKQRALLAMLLLQANRPVSRDRLIEGLWGEQAPPSAAHSLDGYVSRLRRTLGAGRIERRPPGYVLHVEPDELDLHRFESLVEDARKAASAGRVDQATGRFAEALRVWRGQALADIVFEPFAGFEAERLEERRLAVREEWIEVRLALGEGTGLVPLLEDLVREHPFRERPIGQLMLALYRSGRQTDALAVFTGARHRLATELGLEPGSELRSLEQRILQHNPALNPPRGGVADRRPHSSRLLAAVAGVVLAAGAAAGVVLATRGTTRPPSPSGATSRLLLLDSDSARVTKTTGLPGLPTSVAVGFGSLWIADPNTQAVERISPTSRVVVDRVPIGGEPGRIVVGGGAVWVAGTLGGTIHRIDPATDTVTQTVRLGGASASDIAFGGNGLWVADSTDKAVVAIDSTHGSVVRTLSLDLQPSGIAVGKGEVWVAGYDEGTVEGIDLRSGRTVATVNVGNGPTSLLVSGKSVWVANSLDASVSRIDRLTGTVVATIPVGSGPSALALASGSLWVANTFSGDVSKINLGSNTVVATTRIGGKPGSLSALRGHIWVAAGPGGETHRGGTLTLVSSAPFPTIDPALDDFAGTLQFGSLVHDNLVTFARTAGPDGLRLVPDLAVALPRPTNRGTTYAFRLRPGILYSDGRPLRAGDFRREFERLFSVGSHGMDLFSGIVGAQACIQRPMHCDLSNGVVTDDGTRTVIFRLRAPDVDFLYKLAVFSFSTPVPPGTPARDAGLKPIVGTGPYRVVRATTREVRLVRNRFFHEWSHAAQPSGNPNRITWRFTRSPAAGIRAVESERADWLFDTIPRRQLKALQLRYPGRVHSYPSFVVDFIPLNTTRAPFNDLRVRRALNLAIDRARVAQMYGGSTVATPICQPLAPGMPGYRRYCPYTLSPTRTEPGQQPMLRAPDSSWPNPERAAPEWTSGVLPAFLSRGNSPPTSPWFSAPSATERGFMSSRTRPIRQS